MEIIIWNDFKDFITRYSLPIFYVNCGREYCICTIKSNILFYCILIKGADTVAILDFETNYKDIV